jgi:RND family efflux transporter MFP subunit
MTPASRARRLVGVLTTAVLIAACGSHTAEEVESETVVTVKTTAARLGTIRGIVHATGVVTPAPGAELVVVAPDAARIAEISHAAGDRVRRGDILVRFDIPSLAAEVQRQQAEVSRALAAIESAKAAQTRARNLFERGVAARREVEEATRAVADVEASLAQARASLAASQSLAERAIVRATFDGVVAKRLHNPGDLVEPSSTDPVMHIIDPRRLEIVASVPLSDVSRVVVGAPARAAIGSAEAEPVALRVISRPAAVDTGTATVPVRLSFMTPTGVPVGMPAQIEIDAEQHRDVVVVPAVALVREGEEAAVFVASDGTAHRRAVQIGLSDTEHVEIVSGIKAGELVIVDGQAGLPDDAAVAVANEEAGGQESRSDPAARKDTQR